MVQSKEQQLKLAGAAFEALRYFPLYVLIYIIIV